MTEPDDDPIDWLAETLRRLNVIAAREWPEAMRHRDPREGPPDYPHMRGGWLRGREIRNAIGDIADYESVS